jgi:dolichyl-phosphate beta-glucosyltransferase
MENMPFLSVAISAYNEEQRISPTLRTIIDYLSSQPYTWEIVVNDDGSKDRTVEVVKSFADERIRVIESPVYQGKGGGIKRAMLNSRGEYILFSDADLATPITEVEKMLPLLAKDYDLVIGCRIQPDGYDMRESQPLYRRAFGKFYHFLVWALVLRGIKDTQSGFKCFRKEVAERLFSQQKLNSIIFDVEILYMARRYGYRIAEVPIKWNDASGSRMHVTARHAWVVIRDTISIPFIHRTVKPLGTTCTQNDG